MAKDMLFNNYWTYIASGSGDQAEETFTTLEKLANDNIDSFMGSTGIVFKNEIVINNSAGDGFSHSSNGYNYSVYNGSTTHTLNSNVDKKRGKRGNVIFDECGFLSDEMMNVYGAFAIVNKSFKSGTDGNGKEIDSVRLKTLPKEIPNQLFYISSASSTDTKFYSFFKEFSKKMFMGDKRYFVALIPCDVPLKPTIKGKVMNPLYEKSIIESELKTNPEKARREYYCQFTTDAGTSAIVRRDTIMKLEKVYKPILFNDKNRKIVICYDPARKRDNSVVLVGEIYEELDNNGNKEIRGRVINLINLIDIGVKRKCPMQTPDQINYIKELILDYDKSGVSTYDNIHGIYIDAGSGGAGVNIADFFMEDWTGKDGLKHRGLIDKIYSEEYVSKYPNAVDKIKLIEPSKYKSEMFEATIELTSQGIIDLTAPYDGKEYLIFSEVDTKKEDKLKKEILENLKSQKLSNEEINNKLNEELSKYDLKKSKRVKLSWLEMKALSGIDALKEELVNMERRENKSGKDSFELVKEKQGKLHDDRAYVFAMFCYAVQTERRKHIINKEMPKQDGLAMVGVARRPQLFSR